MQREHKGKEGKRKAKEGYETYREIQPVVEKEY